MKALKAFKYRLFPTIQQQSDLAIQFGHARYVYNYALDIRKSHYKDTGKGLFYSDTAKMLPRMKDDILWLKQADSQVLQQKLKDLDRAYVNFFQHRAGYPRFKKRHDKQSIRYPQRFKFENNKTYLPKVGWVRTIFHRAFEGIPKNVTISKIKSGKFFVSIQCELELSIEPNNKPAIGVDLGLKHLVTLSTGEKIEHPKYFRCSETRLAMLQRRLSKKKKGSANRNKDKLKVAKFHEHTANQRKDFLDKLSYRLVTKYGFVGLEDLNIKGMIKSHCLSKSIADSGWGAFRRMCEYKAPWYGSYVATADRFFASSKLCHICGYKNAALILKDRTWTCKSCGTIHDRDENAAINIKQNTVGATGFQAFGDSVRHYSLRTIAHLSMN